MEDELKFDFCDIQIYDSYMVTIMKEGVTITPEHNDVLLNIVETYYSNREFVYITHRLNSYAVDPAIYFETSKIDNLVGFAVVSKDFKAKSNAEVEKLFLNKPFEIFNTLKEAVTWAHTVISS
ncbi:MAG: hypothetical protein ACSHXF_14855 [Aquaticitalea sp.]